MLLDELGFLDDPAKPLPASIPWTRCGCRRRGSNGVLERGIGRICNTTHSPENCPDWADEFTNMGDQVMAAHPGDANMLC